MIYLISAELVGGRYLSEDARITRSYRIGGSATLDDLAMLILESVNFDFEHLYQFNIDSKSIFKGTEYCRVPQSPKEKKTKTKLYDLGFKKGMPFVFLYDYGDEWIFQLRVDEILDDSGNIVPSVDAAEGEVEQYPSYDDEIWDDYDEEEDFDTEEDFDAEEDFDTEEEGYTEDFCVKNGMPDGSGISFLPRELSDDIDFSDEYFEEDDEIINDDYNPRFGRIILRIVEHQLDTGHPAIVTETYRTLQQLGIYRKEAKVRIGMALISLIYDLLKNETPYSDDLYESHLKAVTDRASFSKPVNAGMETGAERRFGEILIEIDDCIVLTEEEDRAAEMFLKLWPSLKDWVLRNYAIETESGNTVFSPGRISDLTEDWVPLFNVLQEIDQAFLNTKRYQDLLKLFPDILSTFSWEEQENATLKAGIGEALEALGRKAEADAFFERWYSESPGNPDCTNYYVSILCDRNDMEKARRVLEENLPASPVPDPRFVNLYMRAAEFYRSTGERQKAALYASLGEKSLRVQDKNIASGDFYGSAQPVAREKKIYPNDPCPCGSGKKYKKCCGR